MRHKDIPSDAVEDPENQYWYYQYINEDNRWRRFENNVNITGNNSLDVVPNFPAENVPEQVKSEIGDRIKVEEE